MRRIVSAVCLALVATTALHAADELFRNGRTDYTIVVDADAPDEVRACAEELQEYVRLLSGAEMPITTQMTGKDVRLRVTTQQGEGYHYYKEGSRLVIEGGGKRGLLYGIYAFLEQEMGVRWLTPDETWLPRLKKYRLRDLDVAAQPAFDYRMIYTYDALHSDEWCAHNGVNQQDGCVKNRLGGMEAWWGMHTFHQLVPTETYYDKHPEFFGLWEGKRIDDGQLCLTNARMLDTLVTALERKMAEEPDYWVYDVSQNDNLKYCQCDACTALAEQYGGQSGLMIWFVNQVAARIGKTHPEKYVGTFAYRYTREVPRDIRPAPNVAVRLCSFECCFAHNLDDCQRNTQFVQDLKGWHALTQNLYVYDYCVGFKQYIAPLPYFRPLQNRLQRFRQEGVKGVLELGAYDTPWSDFSELKNWVMAKLLWNPSADVDSLAQIFIEKYYGKAAKPVQKFYLLTQQLPQPETHFTIYCDYKNSAFTADYMTRAMQLADDAVAAAGKDTVLLQRVNRVVAQALFLQVMHHPVTAPADGTLERLRTILSDDPTYLMEHRQTLDDLLRHWTYI